MKNKKNIAQNKKASFDYFIEDRYEAGIVLKGSEVRSTRLGKVNLIDAHASHSGGEVFLYNSHIEPYVKASHFNHEPRRVRKLLLKKREIKKIIGKIKIKGYTLLALSMYFNEKNIVKVEVGVGKGKKLYDKRDSIKAKDIQRELQRSIKDT